MVKVRIKIGDIRQDNLPGASIELLTHMILNRSAGMAIRPTLFPRGVFRRPPVYGSEIHLFHEPGAPLFADVHAIFPIQMVMEGAVPGDIAYIRDYLDKFHLDFQIFFQQLEFSAALLLRAVFPIVPCSPIYLENAHAVSGVQFQCSGNGATQKSVHPLHFLRWTLFSFSNVYFFFSSLDCVFFFRVSCMLSSTMSLDAMLAYSSSRLICPASHFRIISSNVVSES